MIYTGGTTGKPKGALRAASDAQITLAFMQALGMIHEAHAHLVAGPLYHSAPGSFALFAAVLGGTVVVMPKFDPERALHLIQEHRITSTFMAPTLIKRIVDLPESVRARYDVSSMRSLVVAAAPCPMRVKEAALAYFGPCLYEFYGSTELGINTILRPEDVLRKPGSCGRAAPNVEIALLDDDGRSVPAGEPSEVYVRRFGGMFDSYYKNADATRQTERGGWHSVGDVAWVDAEGFYTLCDRDVISPATLSRRVERASAPGRGVFGVPDDDRANAFTPRCSYGRTRPAADEPARRRLADYKVPREVSPVDFAHTAGKLLAAAARPLLDGRKSERADLRRSAEHVEDGLREALRGEPPRPRPPSGPAGARM
jgi:acyl-CoA synthetase (AMP-forming)/AMP-acid ligase II